MCLLSSHKRQVHLTSSNLSLIFKCSQDAQNISGFSNINAFSCSDIRRLTAIESMVSRAARRLYRITHLIHEAINECPLTTIHAFISFTSSTRPHGDAFLLPPSYDASMARPSRGTVSLSTLSREYGVPAAGMPC